MNNSILHQHTTCSVVLENGLKNYTYEKWLKNNVFFCNKFLKFLGFILISVNYFYNYFFLNIKTKRCNSNFDMF